jgi:hemoglobin
MNVVIAPAKDSHSHDPRKEHTMSTTLFERLGQSQGIERIVDEIAARHLANPLIAARFRPFLEPRQRFQDLKTHLVRFLEMGSGGPARYAGRDMRTAHTGMNISAAEYVAAIDDILAALEHEGIDEQTRAEVLAIAWSLKGDIIHV